MAAKTQSPREAARPLFQCSTCKEARQRIVQRRQGRITFVCVGDPERPGCRATRIVDDPLRQIRQARALAERVGLGPDSSIGELLDEVERQVGQLEVTKQPAAAMA